MKPILVHTLKPLRSSAPATSILSAQFKYVPSAHTDLRVTFARLRSASHDEFMRDRLANPEFAAAYLRAALAEKDDPGALITAARRVAAETSKPRELDAETEARR